MKKLKSLLLVVALMLSLVTYATKDPIHPITMVSYEQGWLDDNGTLALKNNTVYDVQNVSFRITYLSMSGTPLDYKDFTKKVSIAPGMTKKINIPAYERERRYSYYTSEASISSPHRFKIKFTMTDYKVADSTSAPTAVSQAESHDVYTENPSDGYPFGLGMDGFYMLLPLFLAFPMLVSILVALYVIVVLMARNRDKNPIKYVILSMFVTPLVGILILSFTRPVPEPFG